MSVSEIVQDLHFLERLTGKVLDYDASLVLEQVVAQLNSSRPRGRSRDVYWEFEIPERRPLRFLTTEEEGTKLQPDVFCRLIGPGELGWPFQRQEVVIRVWSLDNALSFRPDLDSGAVRSWLEQQDKPSRVMFRLHFDRANQGQRGTVFHFQVGGRPAVEEREKCWLSGIPSIPRIPFYPIDLVLACELVIANFFHETFLQLSDDPSWRGVVKRAEMRTVSRYYEFCHSYLTNASMNEQHTLLKSMWNI